MGTSWILWLRGPRAVQRELDRTDAQLAAARDALVEARRAVIDVRALFGDTAGDAAGDVVDIDVVRRRRRRSRPKVPVVAFAAGTAALVAAAAMITDARMVPFLPDPEVDLRRSPVEQTDAQMEPVVDIATDPDGVTPGAPTPASAGSAAAPGEQAPASGAVTDSTALVDVPEPGVPAIAAPPLPPVPELPELPDPPVPEVPPLPPPPPLP